MSDWLSDHASADERFAELAAEVGRLRSYRDAASRAADAHHQRAEEAERQLADMRAALVDAETGFHIIAGEAHEDRIVAKALRFEEHARAALASAPASEPNENPG